MRFTVVIAAAGLLLAQSSFGQVAVTISADPPLSPAEVASLEAAVKQNPADSATRLRLLRFYTAFAPANVSDRSSFRSDRLAHILYWIENNPSDRILSSDLMYVPSANGPFADTADHGAVLGAWMRAVARQPEDVNVLLNATRFVHREHPEDAHQMLSRVLERDPANRRVAANLGFLYALEILSATGIDGEHGSPSDADRDRLRERAQGELDGARNVFVLAGAGTALPNLIPRTQLARIPGGAESLFQLAARLMARARELAPNEPELQGPMPLIAEFQEFQGGQGPAVPPSFRPDLKNGGPQPSMPTAIRVGGVVQAAKLIEKPEAIYPPMAIQSRIQGTVRFNVVISQDGRVENATLASGHPLLVPAAVVAVQQYRYQPTLLNGNPVQVITQVDVPFLLSQ